MFPYMNVADPDATIRFFEAALPGGRAGVYRDDDGKVVHAELIYGNAGLMIGPTNEQFPAQITSMYVYVEDADMSYSTALSAGAVSEMEPQDTYYGERCGAVKDANGITWCFAHALNLESTP